MRACTPSALARDRTRPHSEKDPDAYERQSLRSSLRDDDSRLRRPRRAAVARAARRGGRNQRPAQERRPRARSDARPAHDERARAWGVVPSQWEPRRRPCGLRRGRDEREHARRMGGRKSLSRPRALKRAGDRGDVEREPAPQKDHAAPRRAGLFGRKQRRRAAGRGRAHLRGRSLNPTPAWETAHQRKRAPEGALSHDLRESRAISSSSDRADGTAWCGCACRSPRKSRWRRRAEPAGPRARPCRPISCRR